MGPLLNIVPPIEERPIPISNKKYSEPLSPAAAIAATARANPHKARPNSTSSLATVTDVEDRPPDLAVVHRPRRDKASVVLGIQHRYGATCDSHKGHTTFHFSFHHRKSMEPIPASARTSIATSRSVPNIPSSHSPHMATTPLTSLYVVSGKSAT